MPSETEITEFLSLLADTREQLTYFKELGVERLGKGPPLESTKTTVAREPALSSSVATRDQAPLISASATPVVPAPDARAKKLAASLPADTLFGELSSQPVRIPKSSESFEEIWADVGDCTRCPLHQGRTNIVHTDGNQRARLMFVGEAPGADEDAQARPFVGRAGQLLTKIIEAIGFKREEVLIGNVNRCRPPGNRPPTPEEASMCKPFPTPGNRGGAA